MAIDKFLLDILVCPETKTPVKLVGPAGVQTLNTMIGEGKLKNRGGQVVKDRIDGALLREDRKVAYPVQSDIPVMLMESAIVVEGIAIE